MFGTLKKIVSLFDFFTVLVVFFVCFFIYLGFWQIDRANEKKSIITTLTSKPTATSLLNLNESRHREYQKVKVEDGFWLNPGYVKKNIIKDGVVGVQLYKLYCQGEYCIIVNLGWLPMKEEINIGFIKPLRSVVGIVRPLSYVLIKEKEPLASYQSFGAIVSLDANFLSSTTGKKVIPYEILIDQSLTNYQQLTTITEVSVARHYGYAVQFYLLALVVVIGYIYLKK